MLRILLTGIFVGVNFIAISVLFHTLHRLISIGPEDFGGVSALVSAVVGFIPLIYCGKYLSGQFVHSQVKPGSYSPLVLVGFNFFALLLVLLLWCLLPSISRCSSQKGAKFYEAGKINSAINLFHKAIYQNPDNPIALAALGSIYEEVKDFDQAKKYYSLAIRYNTNSNHSIAPLNHYARLLLKTENMDDAIELLLKAESRFWDNPPSDNRDLNYQLGVLTKNLSWAYLMAGDRLKAKASVTVAQSSLEQAGKLNKYPEVHCLIALLFEPERVQDYVQSCELGYQKQQLESLDIKLIREARTLVEG